jgi:octanoyl-[GcvH]:protein N-octanoyltransferase
VSETEELAPVLRRFYGALGIPFRPESVGDLPVGVPRIIEALVAEVKKRHGGWKVPASEELLREARAHREKWQIMTS